MSHKNQTEQTAPAPVAESAATAQAPAPSFEEQLSKLALTPKQLTALNTLLAEIARTRNGSCIVTDPRMNPADARKLIVMVNGTRVQIGPGGGYEALDVRTYPKATVTFMASADLAYAKQNGRDAAKAAAAQSVVTAAAAANVAAAPSVTAAASVVAPAPSDMSAKLAAAAAATAR